MDSDMPRIYLSRKRDLYGHVLLVLSRDVAGFRIIKFTSRLITEDIAITLGDRRHMCR